MKTLNMTFKSITELMLIATIILVIQGCGSHTRLANQSARQSNDEINEFIDRWHMAASTANADLFFGSMADTSIYIGTDASERWTKPQFISFAKPYFDRGKAWDFKPYDRHLHVTIDGEYVWFSELLTTWMGVCRGSGIIRKTAKGWRIEQYHLSVTVPNDLIKDFIALVDNYNRSKE